MLGRTTLSFCLIVVFLAGGCGVDHSTEAPSSGNGGGTGSGSIAQPDGGGDAPVCAFGQIVCQGNEAKTCDGKGGYTDSQHCDTLCSDGLGCVECVPNTGVCNDGMAKVCDISGLREVTFPCSGAGMTCSPDGCKGDCSPSSLGLSYRGCEFWPTVTANNVWSDPANATPNGLNFGVLLGNVSETATAHIEIFRNDQKVAALDLSPGEVATQALAWVFDLKGPDWETPYIPQAPTQSAFNAAGAYHIISNTPIIAYQFNSLEDRAKVMHDCPTIAGAGSCYAYSTDASLLIPAHALASHYIATSYHSWHSDRFTQSTTGQLKMGDFLAITATAPSKVTIALGQSAVLPVKGAFPDLTAQKATFPMVPGAVLEIFSPGSSENESLSGVEITSESLTPNAVAPVQVLSGMACASIPEDIPICAHIEDPVLPLDVLGKDYVVPALVAVSNVPIAHTIRVHAVSDGTALTFEPAKFNAVTLNRGEVLDIPNVTTDVRITGSAPFAVTQFPNGRGDLTKAGDGQNVGGPNQLSVPPAAQFRTDYSFLASPRFESNYVAIAAPTGASVVLDGEPISAERFTAVGASGMSVTRQPLNNNDHVHVLHADKPVGIIVFGYSPFSNYVYAGGLDLKRGSAIVR